MRLLDRRGTAPGANGAPLPGGAEKLASVRRMFDEVAPRYELVNSVMTFGLDRAWRRHTIDELALETGARVLDLACGTGDLARELRHRGFHAVGTDLSEGMLHAAHGTDSPLFMSDAAQLPVASASFDGVISGFALRNIAELQTAFDECARILRPYGRIALLEVDTPSNRAIRLGHDLWFHYGVPTIGALLSVREAYRYLPRSVAYLPSHEKMQTMLELAGFHHVQRRALLFETVQVITATRRPFAATEPTPNS
jgi:demethylmenaquinone methyltransferase/2-methoxy-6-polyprenyl-1,4-benzoquinol methylase